MNLFQIPFDPSECNRCRRECEPLVDDVSVPWDEELQRYLCFDVIDPPPNINSKKIQEFCLYSNGMALFSGYGGVERYLTIDVLVGNPTGPTEILMMRRKKTQKGAKREYVSSQLLL